MMCGRIFRVVVGLLSVISVTTSQGTSGRIQWIGKGTNRGNPQVKIWMDESVSASKLRSASASTTTTAPLVSQQTPQTSTPIGITASPLSNTTTPRLELSKSLLNRILANIFGKISDTLTTTHIPTTEEIGPAITTPVTALDGQQIDKILLGLTKVRSTLLPSRTNSKTSFASRPQHVSETTAAIQKNNPVYTSRTTPTPSLPKAELIPSLPDSTLEFIAQGLLNFPQGALPLSDASLPAKANSNESYRGVNELYPETTNTYPSTEPSVSTTASIPLERRILPPSILDTIAKGLLALPPKLKATENTPFATTSDTRGTLNLSNLPNSVNPNSKSTIDNEGSPTTHLNDPQREPSLSTTGSTPSDRRVLPPSILDLIAKGLLGESPATATNNTRGPSPNNAVPLVDGSLSGSSGPGNFLVVLKPLRSSSSATTPIRRPTTPSGTGTTTELPRTLLSTNENLKPANSPNKLTKGVNGQGDIQNTDIIKPNHAQSVDAPTINNHVSTQAPHSFAQPTTSQTVLPSSPDTIEASILELIAKGLLSKPTLSSSPDITEFSRVPATSRTTPVSVATGRGNLQQRPVFTSTYSPTPVFRLPPDPIKVGQSDQFPPASPTPTTSLSDAVGLSDRPQVVDNSEFDQMFTTESIKLTDDSSDPGPTLPHRLPTLRRPVGEKDSNPIRPKINTGEAADRLPPATEGIVPAKSHANRNEFLGALFVTVFLHLWIRCTWI